MKYFLNVRTNWAFRFLCLPYSVYATCQGSVDTARIGQEDSFVSSMIASPISWLKNILVKCVKPVSDFCLGGLELAVLFTPSTPNRQNRNQVRCNTCA